MRMERSGIRMSSAGELGSTANRGLVLRASKNLILELNIAILGYKEIFLEDEFNKDVLA